MIKVFELAIAGTMALTTAANIHLHRHPYPVRSAVAETYSGPGESLEIYYSPLSSTKAAAYVGLGTAYHMAVVYTDRTGRSFGASSGPSDMAAPQTAGNAVSAIFHAAYGEPSSFGTLAADPHNNTPFIKGQSGDYYTHDSEGRPYPHSIVKRSGDLSVQWSSILKTYSRVGALHLTYSPMNQNSNSLAAAAVRRAGLDLQFSSDTVFAPDVFTTLPETSVL